MSSTPTVAQIGNILSQITARQSTNPFGAAGANAWFDDFGKEPYPRTDKIKTKFDPLAQVLSFRAKGFENWRIAEHLANSNAWNEVESQEHLSQSQTIKKYYRNKFLISALKNTGAPVSSFRQHLIDFISSEDPNTIYKNDIPMIVKLPDFYEEDTMVDSFAKNYCMEQSKYENTKSSRVLHPLRSYKKKSKRIDQIQFWFKDEQKLIYRIDINSDNPLLHLFDREFAKPELTVAANFFTLKLRGNGYVCYSPRAWTLR